MLIAWLVGTVWACAPAFRSTLLRPPTRAEMSQLWMDPRDIRSRDLFYGAGGKKLAPSPTAAYRFLAKDTKGFSPGYDVRDHTGSKWSVKLGPEAQPEVVASRLLWAVGYHQPFVYFLPQWRLTGSEDPATQPAGRFRAELPGQEKIGDWSWHENPFVGTRPFRGLIVLNLMLNNSDLKASNNALYEVADRYRGPRRWFVVRDVGHSLGRTGRLEGTRGDLEGFEEHSFIERVKDGRVEFEYHGFHGELLRDITPGDVQWVSRLLSRLTDRQWRDAFAAGAYRGETADRFIRRMKQKIEQGLSLEAAS